MKESLDQKRARFAWGKVQGQSSDYTKLAKGAPALIMQSGLMPILAYLRDKGKAHHAALLSHLCEWMYEQFKGRISSAEFPIVMSALMGNASGDAAEHARFYQQATGETLSLLRWIRQFAPAAHGEGGGRDV
ncbi:MAG: type III-B CRISPR module-associated protein Cmr5 [Acidobacteria bacterium]|nr:type III-B CRISPR module-associated protein Cmr5 [Acidobacteriota bacterium]